MKKWLRNPKSATVLGVVTTIVFAGIFIYVFGIFHVASSSVATQQQWANIDKQNFDTVYKIAAAEKEVPDKTLTIPNLCNCLNKDKSALASILTSGANVSNVAEGENNTKVATILLTNENVDSNTVTPTIEAVFDSSGRLIGVSFSCNTWALGYGALSFTDMINNAHIVENTLTEAGLRVEPGTVQAPSDRNLYTTYSSDGATVVSEHFSFSGSQKQDNHTYKWESTVLFDYTQANSKGNLAKTIRTIKININY